MSEKSLQQVAYQPIMPNDAEHLGLGEQVRLHGREDDCQCDSRKREASDPSVPPGVNAMEQVSNSKRLARPSRNTATRSRT